MTYFYESNSLYPCIKSIIECVFSGFMQNPSVIICMSNMQLITIREINLEIGGAAQLLYDPFLFIYIIVIKNKIINIFRIPSGF